jgi:cation diffusion facilitator family transporter
MLTMVLELVVGKVSGSMALTADGWHMATHVGALGISAAAYWYARTRAGQKRFPFGTGKVYSLAGYTNAILLGVVACWMIVESIERFVRPQAIRFTEALPVAVFGLLVNLVSAKLLDHDDDDHDHNIRAAYLHVVADALTSVLAIGALVAGRFLGWAFLDPAMGIIGALVILRWGWGLVRDTSRPLLDATGCEESEAKVRTRLEAFDDVKVADLHLWELGPGRKGCVVALVTSKPREARVYREAVLAELPLAHLTVEVHACVHDEPGPEIERRDTKSLSAA